jgi:hypothetical protein
MKLSDLINAAEIAAYWSENPSNAIPMLGDTLFPARKQLGLTLAWIKGASGLPVALAPAAFDAKATIRDRIGVSKVETEMPFFRESMRIGEKERQQLNMILSAANANMLKPIVAKIYDDASNLISGALVNPERMRMQLLSSGKIDISANGIDYEYDYKLKTSQKTTITVAADKWSATETAVPITNIIAYQDKIEEATGVRPTRGICTRKTWGYLLNSKQVRMDISEKGTTVVTDSILKSYLLDKLGISVAVYNKKYALTVEGDAKSYFPDDVFTLIPDGNLGNTYYGTTPEESDLMGGNNAAAVRIVNTGVAVTTYQEVHPVNSVTVVSAIVLPSFEQGNKIYIASVNG